jgi:hypothetical protein
VREFWAAELRGLTQRSFERWPALMNGVAEVHFYRDIANKAEVDASYVQLVLPLAFIDPQLTRELLDGRRGVSGGLMELLRRGIPADCQQQRAYFRTPSGLVLVGTAMLREA